VRDRKYGYYFRRSCIDEAEWESVQDKSTPFGIDRQSDLRMFQQEICGPSYFISQTQAQTGYFTLVTESCLYQFQSRFGVELKPHFLRRERRSLKTRSPGMV